MWRSILLLCGKPAAPAALRGQSSQPHRKPWSPFFACLMCELDAWLKSSSRLEKVCPHMSRHPSSRHRHLWMCASPDESSDMLRSGGELTSSLNSDMSTLL